MYEAYWQLSEPPFDNSPNPKFFYLSPEHEEALMRRVADLIGLDPRESIEARQRAQAG